MIDCATAAVIEMLRVKEPAPLGSTTSPGTVVVLTRDRPGDARRARVDVRDVDDRRRREVLHVDLEVRRRS
jgi:hypothetical protein